jgi:hypothetical protein
MLHNATTCAISAFLHTFHAVAFDFRSSGGVQEHWLDPIHGQAAAAGLGGGHRRQRSQQMSPRFRLPIGIHYTAHAPPNYFEVPEEKPKTWKKKIT